MVALLSVVVDVPALRKARRPAPCWAWLPEIVTPLMFDDALTVSTPPPAPFVSGVTLFWTTAPVLRFSGAAFMYRPPPARALFPLTCAPFLTFPVPALTCT